MNLYKISNSWECKDGIDGVVVDSLYLYHECLYDNSEFKEICNRAKEDCIRKYNEVSLYTMSLVLTKFYGFTDINVKAECEI